MAATRVDPAGFLGRSQTRRKQADVMVKPIPVLVGDFPFGRAKSTYPKALHVHNSSWVDDEPSVVTLGDGAQLVPE